MGKVRFALGIALFGLFLAAIGCGGGHKMADISGTVKVDGNPVDGSMTFVPVDGNSQTAGCEIKNGKYSAQVPIGMMKVSISVPVLDYKKKLYNTPDSPTGDMMKESLPARYNAETELTVEIKSGSNQKDWELQSK
jgi:hypothetical protein